MGCLSPSTYTVEALVDIAYDPFLYFGSNLASLSTEIPTSLQFKYSTFGGNILSPDGSAWLTAPVVTANPVIACTSLINPLNASLPASDYYAGKLVIVTRGGPSACRWPTKVLNAQKAGAVAVVIVNFGTRYAVVGSTLAADQAAYIPSVSVDQTDGTLLMTALQTKPSFKLNVTIPATGAADPSEWSAMSTILASLTGYGTSPGADGYSQATQDWPKFMNTATMNDPCLNRMTGTYCIGGHFYSIDWHSLDMAGSIHPAFGAFTQLQVLSLYHNLRLAGEMPCSWGGMSQLRYLQLEDTAVTTLSPCISNMTLLELIIATDAKLTNMPAEMKDLVNMQYLYLDNNYISSPMIDISGWSQLKQLYLCFNSITGQVPTLSNHELLEEFRINTNMFSGTIAPEAFDNKPVMWAWNVSTNLLTGPVPNFDGSPAFIYLDFDHNAFTGGFPATWASFADFLTELSGQYNQLSGDISILGQFTSLTTIDLSHNQLVTPAGYEALSDYFLVALPSSLNIANLAYNQLNGSLQAGMNAQPNLVEVYLSHNNITQIPDYLFILSLDYFISYVTILDMSYNPHMMGSLPEDGPTSTLQVLKLQGCPLLRGMVSDRTGKSALPTYITTTEIITKLSAAQRYECPGLTGAKSPLSFTIDPSFYSYEGCSCGQGTYGGPPACLLIPVSAVEDMAYGTNYGGFTDSSYGDMRMAVGMDTSWQLGTFAAYDGSFTSNSTNATTSTTTSADSTSTGSSSSVTFGGNSTSIMAIYINFTLFTDYFQDFNDIIDVYMGDVSLKGMRVTSFRGSDAIKPVSNVKLTDVPEGIIVVFNSIATVNFRSRSQSGQHFYANYTVSTSCPSGYAPTGFSDDSHASCELIIPVFKLSKGVQVALYVVAGVCSALLVAILFVIIYFRSYVIFRAASIPFCTCIVAFGIMMTATSVFYAVPAEEGDWLCHIRPWTTCVSITGLLACLYIKSNRINRIFNNKRLQEDGLDNKTLFKWVGIMLSVQLALLIGFSGAKLTHSQLTLGSKFTDGYQVFTCRSTESVSFNVWLAFQLFYVFAFICAGTVTAFQIRNVPTAFNESAHIANCMYVFCLIMAIILPLNFLVEDNPNALVLIRGMAQNLCAISMCLSIFSPKVFMLISGQGNDSQMAVPKLSGVQVTGASATQNGSRKLSAGAARPGKKPAPDMRKGSITGPHQPDTATPSRKPSVNTQVASRKPSVNNTATTPINKQEGLASRPFMSSSISLANDDVRQNMLVSGSTGALSSSMAVHTPVHARVSSGSDVLATSAAGLNAEQLQSVLTYMASLRSADGGSPRLSVMDGNEGTFNVHLQPLNSDEDHVNRPDTERPEKNQI